ncbi:dicarboxylate/amino acid:cation symporter [Anaerobaca lacustris]|uniref:Dicarboxylate/amino acid:cation symporter n=1 Tax=Anaerobaca lacustris TaxID=3044600 RepID=A0AAW6U0X4_9BACT|nr:dicarboxylate/amino acid:cation symporter [Sedimentisphaerales bacterium M17dextr]
MALPKLQLHTKILLALVAGAGFGLAANRLGLAWLVVTYIQPVGTAFVRLIGMVVVPLVFASLLVGTTSLKDVRRLGRIGVKTIAFYLCTTAIAVSIGLLLANLAGPGSGLAEQAKSKLIEGAERQDGAAEAAQEKPSVKDVLLNIIPTNPIRAFAEGQMLQIIFFALLTGVCLTLIRPERSEPAVRFFEAVNDVMVMMVHLIMKVAPFGVFALIAGVVADFGLHILLLLAKYCAVVVVGLLVHMLLVYSSALRLLTGMGAVRFFRGIRPAQLIAFSSSSSSATLPVTIECTAENLGVSRAICSFTLPLGATINMDGTSLYQGVSAVFLAQLYGMDLSVAQQLAVVLTATLASIGTAGTPGAGIVTLAIVLSSIGVPLQGIGIIMGVERILDMCRSVVNVTGDAACAAVVAATEDRTRNVPTGALVLLVR